MLENIYLTQKIITEDRIQKKKTDIKKTINKMAGINITFIADGDCSHEIKKRLLLGRKVMTDLDSLLKSRDVTLPTKVHLIKAMVFPVVMYGCETWTTKKAER